MFRMPGRPSSPATRYFWRVQVWDASGKPYTPSETSWWETGLLSQDNWTAEWIGYETPEESTMRHAPAAWITSPDAMALAAEKSHEQDFAWRTTITLSQPVRFAALYAAGQDTVSAWIDGTQVLAANLLPPWQQMPWKKYVRADVTAQLSAGANSIAIQSVHYVVNPNGMATEDSPPMIATLVVQYADGSWANFTSSPDWKVAIHADAGWQQKGFDDSGWKKAVAFAPLPGSTGEPLGIRGFRLGEIAAANIHSQSAHKIGAHLCHGAGRVRTLPERQARRRRGSCAGLDGLSPTREVPDLRCNRACSVSGQNAIAALLAPGWYATPLEWFQQPNNYGDTPPALRAQLRIEHTDGSVEWVNTDAQWQAHPSSILHSELYDGETQDAREAQPGWNTAQFAAKNWEQVTAIEPAPVNIEAQELSSHSRRERPCTPKVNHAAETRRVGLRLRSELLRDGTLRVEGPAGTNVRLRFAEVLNPDGTIYTDNLRTAMVTDHFILRGAQEAGRGRVHAAIHLPRFPLCGDDRTAHGAQQRTRLRPWSSTPTRLSRPSSIPAAR